MSYQLKAEKMIARPAADVFRALREGRLFMNCGASSGTMKIDFRVGGKYQLDFKSHQVTNWGEFLEIIPDKKIVFTWCQDFGAEQKPDTQVTIELFADGAKTRLALTHTGFKNQEVCDGHKQGWTTGMVDLGEEMENGRLRMVRRFQASPEKLYETCKNPESFFAFMGDIQRGSIDFRVGGKYQVPTQKGEIRGEFLEIVPGKKITLSWLSGCGHPLENSKVTLTFNPREDGISALELIHDGLETHEDQMAHRSGWEVVTAKIVETLAANSRS